MDRRTFLAILLSLGIWAVWFAIFPPAPPPEAGDETPVAGGVGDRAPVDPSLPAPTQVVERELPFEGCGLAATASTARGGLQRVVLPQVEGALDVQPLWRWILGGFDGPWRPYGPPPGPEELVSAHGVAFTAGPGATPGQPAPTEVIEATPSRLVTRSVTAGGLEIVRTLQASGVPCRVTLDVTWRNLGSVPFTGGVWVGVHDRLEVPQGQYDHVARPVALVDGDLERLDDLEEAPSGALAPYLPLPGPSEIPGPVGFVGMDDPYFGLYLVPKGSSAAAARAAFTSYTTTAGVTLHGVTWTLPDPLPAGATVTASFVVYAGAKVTEALEAVDPILGEAVELGFFSALARPLLWAMKLLYHGLGNWGLAIIALTFLIKLLFYPLTHKSMASSQAMVELQPQMNELREKYKNNPEEMNRRMLALWQEHGVNPMMGCLPMLVQMPVWIALYAVLGGSVELYHADFLYLKDLSVPDPYMALPAAVMLLMVGQQRLMPTAANMDPAQQQMMKWMPVIFGLFFFALPSGLMVYMFVNMVLSILQQWYIRRSFRLAKGSRGATP